MNNTALWHYLGTNIWILVVKNNSTPGVLIEEMQYACMCVHTYVCMYVCMCAYTEATCTYVTAMLNIRVNSLCTENFVILTRCDQWYKDG